MLYVMTSLDGDPHIQTYPWSDSLFCLTWSERNSNVIVSAAGDGNIQVYDITNSKVTFTNI